MKTIRSLLINFLIIVLLVSPVTGVAAPPPPTPVAPAIDPVQRQAIEQAVSEAIQAEAPGRLYFMIYDVRVERIELNADKNLGVAWLVPVDPKTGQAVPTEPAVAVVDLPAAQSAWQVTLPTRLEIFPINHHRHHVLGTMGSEDLLYPFILPRCRDPLPASPCGRGFFRKRLQVHTSPRFTGGNKM